MDIKSLDKTYVAGTYNRFPVQIVRGSGSEVFDENGKRYIDLGSGIAVTSFGIGDEAWKQAVVQQIGQVQHMSNLYYTEPCARLAEMLCSRTGMKKVFFSNSGAEANECAIKVARKYAMEHRGADCYTIVTLKNSFHGRTLTTLAATGQDHYHELFQPLTPGFAHVEAGNREELEQLCASTPVAAVLVECVQGEGGVIALSPEYLQWLRAYTEKQGILLMIDEVQTGNGRTGELYAYMHYGIMPDVVSTAKGLAGGLPLGATMLGEKVQDVLGFGDHGSTFGGNPVCCAAALSILERLDAPFLKTVQEKSKYVRGRLSGTPGVNMVSGLGLMVGICTEKAAGDVVRSGMEHGILCLTAKDRVRLLPALNIPMPVLEEAMDILCGVIAGTI